MAQTSVGETSTNRSECSSARIACRSAAVRARGWTRRGAGPAPAAAAAGTAGAPIPGRLRPADRRAGARRQYRGEFCDRRVSHGLRPRFGAPALGERLQERVQFSLHVPTKRALANSCSSRFFSASSRAICSACRRGASGRAVPSARPGRRRHEPGASRRCDWNTSPPVAAPHPFSPSGAASYSATISSLYCVVNVRRVARAGTSGSGRAGSAASTRPGSPTPGDRSNVVTLIVMRVNSPFTPSGA